MGSSPAEQQKNQETTADFKNPPADEKHPAVPPQPAPAVPQPNPLPPVPVPMDTDAKSDSKAEPRQMETDAKSVNNPNILPDDEKLRPYIEQQEKLKAQQEEEKKQCQVNFSHIHRQLRPFYLHQWIDAKDTQGTWLEAIVVQLARTDTEEKIFIHYKGWKEKYDEWLSTDPNHPDSQRMAVYGTRVQLPQKFGMVIPHPGLHCDILDTTDKWCSGQVVTVEQKRDGPMCLVRYTGWDPKYDEWIPAESYRLAPLRQFTRPERPPALRQPSLNHQVIDAFRATHDNESKFDHLLRTEKGWTIIPQAGDGNCMFRSVAHQVYGNPELHNVVRSKCMDYLASESAFFRQYVEGDFHQYVERMRLDGEWGDHVELQALSELYQRPVEVYAYSTEPRWRYRGPFEHKPPIRLSYHFQSHYNSVMPLDENAFTKNHLKTMPGAFEELQIATSRRRGIQRPNDQKDSKSTEEEQLRLALALSRGEFNGRSASAEEIAIQNSLREFSSNVDKQLEDAKKASLQEFNDRVLRDSNLQMTEEELLKQAQAASLSDGNIQMDDAMRKALEASVKDSKQAAPQDDLARALALSVQEAEKKMKASDSKAQPQDDLARALALSQQEFEKKQGASPAAPAAAAAAQVPKAVRDCQDFGFSLDEAMTAYTVMYDPNVTDEILTQNMVTYLISR